MLLDLSTGGIVAGDALPLTSDGVLPALRGVATIRPEALGDDALALVTRLREVLARAETVLAAGASTSRDLRQLEADLTACLEDLVDFRADLDAWRAVDALPVVDPAVLLRSWSWERGLRRALVRLQGRIGRLRDQAVALAAGRPDRVAIVRSGDTWQKLAQKHLGDWRSWRVLVEHNAGDPAGPTPGAVVQIPG